MTEFAVQEADVAAVASDLLLLKHAQSFYGADAAVATLLSSAGVCTYEDLSPAPGDFAIVETRGVIAPKRVMFLGTPPLRTFTYGEMHQFAYRAIEKIADLGLSVQMITTTVHGTGYGLDGGEALQRLVRGFRDGLSRHGVTMIQKITFLTLGERAARMLSATLEAMETDTDGTAMIPLAARTETDEYEVDEGIAHPPFKAVAPASLSGPSGTTAVGKKRVFVALPFSEEFQNVYEFGIYPAVRSCGFICERVDETHFTGDVLGRIREGIEAASFVIADLTEGRPNVYLEVGYAWGKGIPVIFVARKGEQLHFDVSTHRCIFYGRFTQFAKDLEELIRGIDASRHR
jgi:hypothetical protein